MPKVDPSLLRELNSGAVLTVLREGGSRRLADLATLTGLSRPTVGASVDELVKAGWVEYAVQDAGPSSRGRPARVARFRSSAAHVVGIDLGPHKVMAAVGDLDGELVASSRREIRDPADRRRISDDVVAVVGDVLAAAGLRADEVSSVALGAPGVVHRGTLTRTPSMPGWTSLSVSEELGRTFDCPVHVHNDANLAALAEEWRGVAAGAHTVVFVQWGERLGTGVLIAGRVHSGAHGAAGEIGYLALAEHEDATPDADGLGPLERTVNAGALARLAGVPDAAAAFAAASGGDARAQAAVDAIAAGFARGVAPLVLALDPDVVVIGGGLSMAGDQLLGPVRRHLEVLTVAPCRIELSALRDHAVLSGAVRLALTDVEERLLPTRYLHR